MNIWSSPSGREFIDDICSHLRIGREHCVAIVPAQLQTAFLSSALRVLREYFGQAQMTRLNPEIPLLENLEPEFCTASVSPNCIAELADRHLSEGNLLVILLPDEKKSWPEEYQKFLEYIGARAKAGMDSQRKPDWNLLCICSPGAPVREDIGMRFFRWWGRAYPSDLEYVIERALRPQGLGLPAYTWYYALCRSFGNVSLELVPDLSHQPIRTMDEIYKFLKSHKLYDKEIGTKGVKWLKSNSGSQKEAPASQTRMDLWRTGALQLNCQGRPCLHPAAMLAAGQKRELENLAIAGQMQTYLPLSHEVFCLIKKTMASRFGPSWASQLSEPLNSLGKLTWLLGNFYGQEASAEKALA